MIASEIKIGDQMAENTDHGPLVDNLQFDKVMSYINKGSEEGAKCILGGKRVGNEG